MVATGEEHAKKSDPSDALRLAKLSVSPEDADADEIPSADCLMWEALERRLELHAVH